MSKIITLTSDTGIEMPVNITELQRLADEGTAPGAACPDSYWIVLRLVTCESDSEGWTLTPRGEDLLASAPLITNTAAVDEYIPCTSCGGSGEKPLYTSVYTCERCDGSGREPCNQGIGWTLIDSEEAARRFVGKRVKVDASAAIVSVSSMHEQTAILKRVDLAGLYFDDCVVNFWLRKNVRLRLVD